MGVYKRLVDWDKRRTRRVLHLPVDRVDHALKGLTIRTWCDGDVIAYATDEEAYRGGLESGRFAEGAVHLVGQVPPAPRVARTWSGRYAERRSFRKDGTGKQAGTVATPPTEPLP